METLNLEGKSFYDAALARASESKEDTTARKIKSQIRKSKDEGETFLKTKARAFEDLSDELEEIKFDPTVSFEVYAGKQLQLAAFRKEYELLVQYYKERYS